MRRLVWNLLLLATGAFAGLAGAAGLLRGWLSSRGDGTSDEIELVAIYTGIDLKSRSTAFRGGRVLAWFSGVALDLREATIVDGAELDLRSLFGGISIRVPAGCRVDGSGTALIGGVSTAVADPAEPDAPTLVVQATSIFGGIAVHR